MQNKSAFINRKSIILSGVKKTLFVFSGANQMQNDRWRTRHRSCQIPYLSIQHECQKKILQLPPFLAHYMYEVYIDRSWYPAGCRSPMEKLRAGRRVPNERGPATFNRISPHHETTTCIRGKLPILFADIVDKRLPKESGQCKSPDRLLLEAGGRRTQGLLRAAF